MKAENLNFPDSKQTCHEDSLIGRLFHFAQTTPQNQAVASLDNIIDYSKLAKLVVEQVDQLQSRGISKDSVVAVQCKDEVLHLVLTLALIYIGAPSFALETSINEEEKKALLRRLDVTNVVDESNAISLDSKAISDSTVRPSKENLPYCNLYFSTSGTSGTPKIVVLQDQDIVEQAPRHIQSNSERFACIATIEYNFARRHRLYCLAMGACNVFFSNSTAKNPSLIDQCQQLNVNVLHVSSFQAQSLLGMENLSALQGIRLKLGGSHVPFSLREELRQYITDNLQAGYGTTETGAICFTDPKDLNSSESVGKALPGVTIKIVGHDEKELNKHERGEILIHAKGLFREYLGMNEKTEERIQDGWFNTGDIGYLDKEGRLFLSGRTDDMFTFNSINIYPQDIESELIKHPAVKDAAVFAKSSAVHGNIPMAVVSIQKEVSITADELKREFKKSLGTRSPQNFSIVEKIPRNSSGKVLKTKLVERANTEQAVRKTIISVLQTSPNIKLGKKFSDNFIAMKTDVRMSRIHVDSLTRMNLIVAIEADFDTIITPKQFNFFNYLGDVAKFALDNRLYELSSKKNHKQNNKDKALYEFLSSDNQQNYSEISSPPHIIKLVKRILKFCNTTARLNKMLMELERRITPDEVAIVCLWYQKSLLSLKPHNRYYQHAFSEWINNLENAVLQVGKTKIEPFEFKRIAPNLVFYRGINEPKHKTLVVCFGARGSRTLSIPNAVLLQYSDSRQYDFLFVGEPLGKNYWKGVPGLGKNVFEVIRSIQNIPLLENYQAVRTTGFSAGAYPAIIAGNLLRCEMAVSYSCRFDKFRKHPIKFLYRLLAIIRSSWTGRCNNAILVYANDSSLDRKSAKIISFFASANKLPLYLNEKKVHFILDYLMKTEDLDKLLARTLFVD